MPNGNSPMGNAGTVSGTRDTMKFEIVIEATANPDVLAPPPVLTLQIVGRSYISHPIASLVAGSNPPRYSVTMDVTKELGRLKITTRDYASSEAQFKVDKRSQIVQVANSWVGATSAQIGGNCNDLVGKVYNHVGLPLTIESTQAQYNSATTPCTGDGCILFYHGVDDSPNNVAHDAIKDGTQRININSNTEPGEPVLSEDVNAGILSGAPNLYSVTIQERSTVDLDED